MSGLLFWQHISAQSCCTYLYYEIKFTIELRLKIIICQMRREKFQKAQKKLNAKFKKTVTDNHPKKSITQDTFAKMVQFSSTIKVVVNLWNKLSSFTFFKYQRKIFRYGYFQKFIKRSTVK